MGSTAPVPLRALFLFSLRASDAPLRSSAAAAVDGPRSRSGKAEEHRRTERRLSPLRGTRRGRDPRVEASSKPLVFTGSQKIRTHELGDLHDARCHRRSRLCAATGFDSTRRRLGRLVSEPRPLLQPEASCASHCIATQMPFASRETKPYLVHWPDKPRLQGARAPGTGPRGDRCSVRQRSSRLRLGRRAPGATSSRETRDELARGRSTRGSTRRPRPCAGAPSPLPPARAHGAPGKEVVGGPPAPERRSSRGCRDRTRFARASSLRAHRCCNLSCWAPCRAG